MKRIIIIIIFMFVIISPLISSHPCLEDYWITNQPYIIDEWAYWDRIIPTCDLRYYNVNNEMRGYCDFEGYVDYMLSTGEWVKWDYPPCSTPECDYSRERLWNNGNGWTGEDVLDNGDENGN